MSTLETVLEPRRLEVNTKDWDDAATTIGELAEMVAAVDLQTACTVEADGSLLGRDLRAWWSMGGHSFDGSYVSAVTFEASDEVVKHYQSRLASRLALQFFGLNNSSELPDIIVENDVRDAQRSAFRRDLSADAKHRIVTSGQGIKDAIRFSAQQAPESYIGLVSAVGRHITQARVLDGRLELRVPETLIESAEDCYKRVMQKAVAPRPRFDD